uniref:Secreted protein n=1 Tax=Ditylenchus dipsaci TaxID=166011 RepID=A0A915D390_9BILA
MVTMECMAILLTVFLGEMVSDTVAYLQFGRSYAVQKSVQPMMGSMEVVAHSCLQGLLMELHIRLLVMACSSMLFNDNGKCLR